MKHRISAFTLVELLVVIAIIGVLAAIAIVGIGAVVRTADNTSCASQLRSLAQSYLSYVDGQSIRFPPLTAYSEYGSNGKYSCNAYENYYIVHGGRFSQGFGPLTWSKLVATEYYVCPLEQKAGNWWHAKTDAGGPFWHSGLTNPHPENVLPKAFGANPPAAECYSSYSLRAKLYPWTHSQLEAKGVRAFMADNFGKDVDMVIDRHETGINVAYLDGSVMFHSDPELTDKKYIKGGADGLDALWDILDSTK